MNVNDNVNSNIIYSSGEGSGIERPPSQVDKPITFGGHSISRIEKEDPVFFESLKVQEAVAPPGSFASFLAAQQQKSLGVQYKIGNEVVHLHLDKLSERLGITDYEATEAARQGKLEDLLAQAYSINKHYEATIKEFNIVNDRLVTKSGQHTGISPQELRRVIQAAFTKDQHHFLPAFVHLKEESWGVDFFAQASKVEKGLYELKNVLANVVETFDRTLGRGGFKKVLAQEQGDYVLKLERSSKNLDPENIAQRKADFVKECRLLIELHEGIEGEIEGIESKPHLLMELQRPGKAETKLGFLSRRYEGDYIKYLKNKSINNPPQKNVQIRQEIDYLNNKLRSADEKVQAKIRSQIEQLEDLDRSQNELIQNENPPLENKFMDFHQLLSGLNFLREKSYVHRDIKPDNILVRETDEMRVVHLSDFGSSQRLNDPQITIEDIKSNFGRTPEYTCPRDREKLEQAAQAGDKETAIKISQQQDVFAMGIVLYQSLYHVPPFLIRDRFPFVTFLPFDERVPEEMQTIIHSMLNISWEKRMTPEEALKRLENAMKAENPYAYEQMMKSLKASA